MAFDKENKEDRKMGKAAMIARNAERYLSEQALSRINVRTVPKALLVNIYLAFL